MSHHSTTHETGLNVEREPHNHPPSEVHHLPFSLYVTVLVTLLVLTAVTVFVAGIDFGKWNLVVAMLIASVKATIVGLFFMHLKYENPLIWIYVVFPIVLVAVMLSGVFIDNPTRYVPDKPSVFMHEFAIKDAKPEAKTEGAHH